MQRRLARTALITNEGFRDVLEIGTQMRPRVYDLWTPQPRPVVAREDAFGVPGRLAAGGAELQPLDEAALAEVAAELGRRGIEAIAIVFLHAFADDRHERRAAEILAQALPGVPISLSSRVAPEFREYLRASTTALNASLLPLVGGYVQALSERVAGAGVRVPLHLMQSSGGVATADAAAELPVALAASGPAAGVIGSARLGAMVGEQDLLTFDMGGTTADVALVVAGRPQLRFTSEHGGVPVNLPQIDLLSIGAGGGSIARVDAFGALTVGPQSAGAVPGPAAYGLGGSDATVTDAHVVLGTLGVERALGSGQTQLDAALARAAVERSVGEPLGLLGRGRRRGRRARRERDHGAGAAPGVGGARSRSAQAGARRARRRGPDARLRHRRRAGCAARPGAALPGHHRGARAARLGHPARRPQLVPAADGARSTSAISPGASAHSRPRPGRSSRARRTARLPSSRSTSTCATAGRPTT